MTEAPRSTQPHTDLELLERIREVFQQEADNVAQLLASKDDSQLLGQTEFQLRDSLQRAGARALEIALQGRKKGATKAPV